MKTFVYGKDEPPENKEDFTDTLPNRPSEDLEGYPGDRISIKRAYARMTGVGHSRMTPMKKWAKQAAASSHRQNERQWRQEVLKAHRADATLPQEPPLAVGVFPAL